MKFGVCIPHYGRPIDIDALTNMAVQAEQVSIQFGLPTTSSCPTKSPQGRTEAVRTSSTVTICWNPLAF